MPDASQIPLSAGPAGAAQVDYRIPGQVDARIPLATEPFKPIDVFAASDKAYRSAEEIGEFRANQSKRLEQQQLQEEKERDKALLQAARASGLDFTTSEGLSLAAKELGGKVSQPTFDNLLDRLDTKQKAEVALKTNLAKLDETGFDMVSKQHEETTRLLSAPLKAYDAELATSKDPQKALQAFEAAKSVALQAAAQVVSPTTGKLLYPPEKLQQLSQLGPEQLKNVIGETKWHSDMIKSEAATRANNALAEFRTAKTSTEEEFGGIKGQSKVAEVRRMVAAGEMTQDEGNAAIKQLITPATKSDKGWKLTSAGGKMFRANANEGRVQQQTEDGDWEDVAPKDMSAELTDALGGKKTQSAITQRYNARTMTAAGEVLRNVDMIGMLPLGQTRGIFNYTPDSGLMGALKNKITPEEATDYNTALSGLSLELTTVLRNGMQLNEAEIANIEKGAAANPGDSVANTRFKLANVIAKTKVALENFEPSTPQQKEQRDAYLKKLEKYPTPEDVYKENQTGKPRKPTAGESLQGTKLRADARKTAPSKDALMAEVDKQQEALSNATTDEARAPIQKRLAELEGQLEKASATKPKYTAVGPYASPDDVRAAFQSNQLTRDEAKVILNKMGMQ